MGRRVDGELDGLRRPVQNLHVVRAALHVGVRPVQGLARCCGPGVEVLPPRLDRLVPMTSEA